MKVISLKHVSKVSIVLVEIVGRLRGVQSAPKAANTNFMLFLLTQLSN